ncbi:MAG: AAA family ATPase [Candidatus Gracilibacteria bacterium]
MADDGLDESKRKIIKEFFEKKDDKDFKGFKIQAGPGTGKTTLLSHLITQIIERDGIKSFYILSHTNSSIDTINNKIKNKGYNCDIKTIASFFIESFMMPFSYSILEKIKLNAKIHPNNPYINFLEKISNNFSEKQIEGKDWDTFNYLIFNYLNNDFYFNLFNHLLISKGIKYIFIDEYQDTDLNFI